MLKALFGILKAIFIAVFRVLLFAGKLVYRILAFLRIRLLALYVVVCAILSAFLPVFGEGIAYFWIGFALCAAVTAISWIYRGWRKFSSRPHTAEDEEDETEEEVAAARAEEPPPRPAVRYPRYFDVEGAPQYFFAEYEDRYELYRYEESGYTYIRTDYKNH